MNCVKNQTKSQLFMVSLNSIQAGTGCCFLPLQIKIVFTGISGRSKNEHISQPVCSVLSATYRTGLAGAGFQHCSPAVSTGLHCCAGCRAWRR